jgi:hypothetical protein
LVSPESVVLRRDVEGISGLCQKRHKPPRLPAAKNTTERMGNSVPERDIAPIAVQHRAHAKAANRVWSFGQFRAFRKPRGYKLPDLIRYWILFFHRVKQCG